MTLIHPDYAYRLGGMHMDVKTVYIFVVYYVVRQMIGWEYYAKK